MKILLIGAGGQVGWELDRTLQTLGEVIALDYPAIDLAQPLQIRERVRQTNPNLIVNAAAYTAVDKAEDEPEAAFAINATAVGILANEARRIGAAIVHYSTDYVFDGLGSTPYTEQDIPNPLNTYGRSKLEGDRAIQAADVPHLILRVSWVYGSRGKNFMLTMLKAAQEREEIRVVDDQIGAPTWCRMIAEATAQILAQGVRDIAGFLRERGGLYHLTAEGATSWFGFAKAILEAAPQRKAHKLQRLIPIPSAEYPTPARRPAYSLLSSEAAFAAFGIRLPAWEISLSQVLSSL